MSAAVTVTCPMCMHRVDPAAPTLCASCPLGRGCTLACCPNCGYGAPDLERSTLVRVARALARRRRARARAADEGSLAQAQPGSRARIETLEHVPAPHREQLLAYGVAPGRLVDVVQSEPITIVRVEHTELALEPALSRTILVTAPQGGPE